MTPRADRLLLRIAGRVMSAADREWMLGDLEEEYSRRVTDCGAPDARRWLLGETIRLLVHAARFHRPSLKGRHPMRNSLQDVRYAVRLLLRSPAFTLVTALTLALGIGANTAIFSVVHGILIKPLPYVDPDTLLRVFEEAPPETPEFPLSPATFLEYRAHTRAFEALAAYERGDLQLGGDQPEQLRGMRVTAGFFQLLGYQPQLGREFSRADEQAGRGNIAILSHSAWVRRFRSDPGIVGKTATLSGRSFEIVGVLPPGVQHVGGTYRSYPHGESVDVWWPRQLPTTPQPRDRFQHYLNVIGRMRAGVGVAQAQDDLRRMSSTLAQQFPESNSGWSSHVRPLRADIIGTAGTTLFALLAAAAAVLLIACLNVAGLLLGRAITRAREIGVRSALGATRVRLLRQLIIESGLLALLGGALGIAVAYAAVTGLLMFAPGDTPRLQMVSVDRIVLAYTIAATAVTALLFGIAPAIQLARTDSPTTLHGGRATPGGTQQRLRRLVVVAEVALAFVLVVTGGLLLRSLSTLLQVDPGFRSDRVLTAVVNLPPARYREAAETRAFFDRLAERVRALPGVRAAGLGSDLPWTGYDENTGFGIIGRQFADGEGPEARYHFLTPGFVEALGMPLLAGRDVGPSDGPDAPPVVLINETTARRYWGDPRNAVSARLDLWNSQPTVVGVIGDLKDVPWAETMPGGVYFPQAQQWYPQDMFITIRTDADPQSLVEPLRRVVRELDPQLPLTAVRSLDEVAGGAFATRRFTLVLVTVFGVSALFLAVIGVYGVMAQAVGQRVREFGLRQAIGAQPGDILRLVLTGGALMGIAGIVAGLVVALPVARLARSLLFRTSPNDPLTLAAVSVLLLLATLAASYLPARRAMRIDPATALRQE